MTYLYIGLAIAFLIVLVVIVRAYWNGLGFGSDEDRLLLGVEKVGTPAREVIDAVERLKEMEGYGGIRYDAVDFYCERMIGGELISLLDSSLDLQQLAILNPAAVKVVFVLLLRDMMQRFRQWIVPDSEHDAWDTMQIEKFIAGLLCEAQAPMQPYVDWLDVVEDHPTEPTEKLVAAIAKQLGVSSVKLFQYHLAACEVIEEDLFCNES